MAVSATVVRDLTPAEVAAATRIPQYNTGAISAANPYGFDEDGHRTNQMPQARDVMAMGMLARDMALLAKALAEEVKAAALLIAGGPVSSVTVGNGEPQTGNVNINIDEIAAEARAALDELRDAQAVLASRIAFTNAYSLAFGG